MRQQNSGISLTPQVLLWAYANGVFPMADPRSRSKRKIDWYFPDPRGILPLHSFHTPKSLAREVRKQRFAITSDTAFEEVIRACAPARSSSNLSWINNQMICAYTQLHQLGHAHSIEAWFNNQLVGGLYGVHLGSAFFGESMFIRPARGGSNASKVCLVHLVNHLKSRNFTLLDTQMVTPHMQQFGCIEITADQYLDLLHQALKTHAHWGTFTPL